MIKIGDEIVLVYALVKRADYDKVRLPDGSIAKAIEIGPIETLCDHSRCKGWAAIIGVSLARAANKVVGEVKAKLLKGPDAEQPL